MTRNQKDEAIRQHNRAAVGRTANGPPMTAKEHREADARWRQHLRDRCDQLHGRPLRPRIPGQGD